MTETKTIVTAGSEQYSQISNVFLVVINVLGANLALLSLVLAAFCLDLLSSSSSSSFSRCVSIKALVK